MDLMPYVANLRHELAVATEAGDEGARAFAERLAATPVAAVRLNALSDATRDLPRIGGAPMDPTDRSRPAAA
ncbi:hypothetical protein [Streptomyces alboflavus]|uniref:hypothetical protein n=1 Tax=Streptomyces alboflavus TaxID=67267 RepID=UPI0004BF834A|nr:hypothetical protein [Streptomyces alboflavus]